MDHERSISRKIIHCDCDCFYAAVEIRDDPSLKELPVAVGGAPGKRGVLTTCNYVAREYGIGSAMASAYARRLCPQLVILPVNFDKYREASRQIKGIFYGYTDLVEPLSLDEAYLDVTGSSQFRGSATLIARDIRRQVREKVGITLSAGVAPNKFLAKVASDWNKPDGEYVIQPSQVAEFVVGLPVKRIFGVGKATADKMQRLGVETCGDLQRFSVFELTDQFGRFGARLYDLCRGVDTRAVVPSHRRKTLSVEHTYPQDLTKAEDCLKQLPELLVKLKSRLRRVDESYVITKQYVKVKFNNFQTTTVECQSGGADLRRFSKLTEEAFERAKLPVRLLGIGVRFVDLLDQRDPRQMGLFDDLEPASQTGQHELAEENS